MNRIIPRQLIKQSGYSCELFGYRGRHRHLPSHLRFYPQFLSYNTDVIKMIYWKDTYDTRYIEFRRDEIESIRIWNGFIHKVTILVTDHGKEVPMYSYFPFESLSSIMFESKKDKIDHFLIQKERFKWYLSNELIIL